MPQKYFDLPDIGQVLIRKRKGMKNIKIRLSQSGQVLITMPRWIPYATGINFANKQKQWINDHKIEKPIFEHNSDLPLGHKLHFITTSISRPSVKIKDNKLLVKLPTSISAIDAQAQKAVKRGLKKLLMQKAFLLENELQALAKQCDLPYHSLKYKFMKSRWGSCNNFKEITLNFHLLELPYELRQYVMVHELAHTKHMNHGKNFWTLVEQHLPSYKIHKQTLKEIRLNWS